MQKIVRSLGTCIDVVPYINHYLFVSKITETRQNLLQISNHFQLVFIKQQLKMMLSCLKNLVDLGTQESDTFPEVKKGHISPGGA